MEEIWKDIKNYEGLYQVSNLGRVKSLERTKIDKMGRQFHVKEKILNPLIIKGYYAVWLYNEKLGKKRYTVHRLVARSEEHTSELQSRFDLVCRLLLEKKK